MAKITFGPFTKGQYSGAAKRAEIPNDSLWISSNVEFQRGVLKKRPGNALLGGILDATPILLHEYVQDDGDMFLIAATASKLYYYDTASNAWIEKTSAGMTAMAATFLPDAFTYRQKVYLAPDTADGLLVWDGGAGNFTVASNAPQCKYVSSLADHLVVAYTANAPSTVMWANEGDPTDWTGGDSGETLLMDPPGYITGLWRIGDYIYVPRENSIERMTFEGDPQVFTFQTLDAAGCWAPKSFDHISTEGEPLAFYLGSDTIYAFNGIVSRPLNDNVRNLLRDNLNAAKFGLAVGKVWPEKHQYWLSFPSGNSSQNDMTLVYDYQEQSAWLWPAGYTAMARWKSRTVRTIDQLTTLLAAIDPTYDSIDELGYLATTIDGLSGATTATPEAFALGKTNQYVYVMNEEAQSDAGTTIVSLAETGTTLGELSGTPYTAPKDFGRVSILAERPIPAGIVTVSMGVSEDGENITWSAPKAHSLTSTEKP